MSENISVKNFLLVFSDNGAQSGDVLFQFREDLLPGPVPRGRGFRAEIFPHPVFHKNLSLCAEINIIEDLLITQVVKIRDPFL
jgi:hypothetical protein